MDSVVQFYDVALGTITLDSSGYYEVPSSTPLPVAKDRMKALIVRHYGSATNNSLVIANLGIMSNELGWICGAPNATIRNLYVTYIYV